MHSLGQIRIIDSSQLASISFKGQCFAHVNLLPIHNFIRKQKITFANNGISTFTKFHSKFYIKRIPLFFHSNFNLKICQDGLDEESDGL